MRGRYHSAIACEDCGNHEFFACGTCIACHEQRPLEVREKAARRPSGSQRRHEEIPQPYEYRRPQAAPEKRIDPFAGGAFADTNRRLASAGR